MPTVIDSLVVELGLDPKNFTKSQQQALDQLRKFQTEAGKTGKEIEAAQKRMGESLQQMKREALAFLGLGFGGNEARRFFDYVTNLDAAIGRTSKTLGISTNELSAWQGAVEQSGGTAASATAALQGLDSAIQQFSINPQSIPAFVTLFNQLGIKIQNANGTFRTSTELLKDLSAAVQGMDPRRAKGLLMGIPGMNEDMINFLMRGTSGMESMLEAARRAGVTTREAAEAAAAFNQQLSILERTATNTGRAIVQGFLPGLTWFIDKYSQVLQLWNNAPDWVKRMVAPLSPLQGLASGIQGLAGAGGGAPAAAPGGGGGGGAGLSIKPGAGEASPFTSSVMGALGGMPGLDRVTSLNDPFHAALGGQHPLGQALDLTVKDPRQTQAVIGQIKATLAEAGIDANVSFHPKGYMGSTADHIHIGARGAALQGTGAGARAAAVNSATYNSRGGDTNTASTSIGSIVVNAPGGNSSEIAGGIGSALRQKVFTPFNAGQW